MKQWLARDNRHVVFDSTGEYAEDGQHEEVWASPQALRNRITANPYFYRIVYVPGRSRETDFGHILNILWWKDTPKLLVCDEVADLCPVTGVNESMERVLRFARKDRLGFLAASQRIADVSKLFTGGCRMVVLFHTNEFRDLQAIEDRWGCSEMVSDLRPLIHDDISRTTRQIPQCVVIEQGQAPYIYDFATESPIGVSSSPSNDIPEPVAEPDGPDAVSLPAPAPSGEIELNNENE